VDVYTHICPVNTLNAPLERCNKTSLPVWRRSVFLTELSTGQDTHTHTLSLSGNSSCLQLGISYSWSSNNNRGGSHTHTHMEDESHGEKVCVCVCVGAGGPPLVMEGRSPNRKLSFIQPMPLQWSGIRTLTVDDALRTLTSH